MNKEKSFQEKHNHCIAWEKSGQSRIAFCRANGLAPSTFHGWYNQYKKDLVSEKLFSPMVAASPACVKKEKHSVECEIRFPNETQLFLSLQENTLVSIIQGICHAAAAIR